MADTPRHIKNKLCLSCLRHHSALCDSDPEFMENCPDWIDLFQWLIGHRDDIEDLIADDE